MREDTLQMLSTRPRTDDPLSLHPPALFASPAQRLGRLSLALLLAGCAGGEGWPDSDEPRPAALAATPAGALEGELTGPDGGPLAGAFVTTDPLGMGATTGEDGRFRIERLLPGEYTVTAAAPGLSAVESEPLLIEAEGVASVSLTLPALPEQDGLLRVTVLNAFDEPAAAVHVIATDGTLTVEGETDASGALTLFGLGGRTVSVYAADPAGRHAARSTDEIVVPALGGAQVSFALSGQPDPEWLGTSGTRICVMCHEDVAAVYQGSAHAQAMSALEGTPALAFDLGLQVDLQGATATLSREGGEPVVLLEDSAGATSTWPVAGLLGGERRGAIPWTEVDGVSWPLPLAWRPADPRRPGWEEPAWVGTDLDAWFYTDGTFAFSGTPPAAASAENRCFACHATGFTLASDGGGQVTMTATSEPDARWDEAAVGCERCHGPGLSHSAGLLSEKRATIINPDRLDVARGNEVCGQCHSALAGAAHTPYAWSEAEGLFAPGETLSDYAASDFSAWTESGVTDLPGAAADELSRSAHATNGWEARCTDCHDPHGSSVRSDLRQESEDNTLCSSCHLGLDYAGDAAAMAAHTGHSAYDPGSEGHSGQCTGCHMPPTATRSAWSDLSAAGDLASHRFLAVPPAESLATFEAAGATTLEPGTFVPNACQECHAWNGWRLGAAFTGPTGDMTARATHEALDGAYGLMFP